MVLAAALVLGLLLALRIVDLGDVPTRAKKGLMKRLTVIGEAFGLPPIRAVMLLVLGLVSASMTALFDLAVTRGQMSQEAFVTTIAFGIGLATATFAFHRFSGVDSGIETVQSLLHSSRINTNIGTSAIAFTA